MVGLAELIDALSRRFGASFDLELDADDGLIEGHGMATLARMAGRGSCRDFASTPLDPRLVRLLAATALSAPSKSDLQQADIIHVVDPTKRRELAAIVPSMPWVGTAPSLLVFCANNRRIREVCKVRGHRFENDHLDAFFNASVDAGILLCSFVVAAEAAGLGCCPVSVLRNDSARVSDILNLPDHVFAVAGLALGYPAKPFEISPRLDLDVTFHTDRFSEDPQRIKAYDRRRQISQPMHEQRRPDLFEEVADYGWSEDKARQYALPQRQDFGAFIRGKGFNLE